MPSRTSLTTCDCNSHKFWQQSVTLILINPLNGHIKTAEQRTTIQQYRDWYTGCIWVGCYIWYSEEGPGWAGAPPSPLLALPNVTAHPLTTSVYQLHIIRCGTVPNKGLSKKWTWFDSLTSKSCSAGSTFPVTSANTKLSCRRKAARCSVSLNISLRHSIWGHCKQHHLIDHIRVPTGVP